MLPILQLCVNIVFLACLSSSLIWFARLARAPYANCFMFHMFELMSCRTHITVTLFTLFRPTEVWGRWAESFLPSQLDVSRIIYQRTCSLVRCAQNQAICALLTDPVLKGQTSWIYSSVQFDALLLHCVLTFGHDHAWQSILKYLLLVALCAICKSYLERSFKQIIMICFFSYLFIHNKAPDSHQWTKLN